jgi:hypothetical protein
LLLRAAVELDITMAVVVVQVDSGHRQVFQ